MVCFMMLANEEIRELNQLLFNDSLLGIYIVASIYLMTVNRPMWAALKLTVGISIKAGAMHLIPGLLGWI